MAVGRTLVKAVDLLSRGQVVNAGNGLQLYNSDGSELIAVYDPATQTAGDTNGTLNASPEQMAALIGYWEHLGRSHSSGVPAAMESLVADLDALRHGNGSPLAVADSAYLLMRDHLSGGSTLTLGAQVSTPRCPDCGRWMGDVHNCPSRSQGPPPVEAQAPAAVPVPVTPINPVTLVIPATADLADVLPTGSGSTSSETSELFLPVERGTSAEPDPDTTAFAHVLTDAFDKLGDRLGDRLGTVLGETLGDRLGERLGDRLPMPVGGSAPPTPPVPSQVSVPLSPADDRMASALDRLATILQEWSRRVPAATTIEPGRTPKQVLAAHEPDVVLCPESRKLIPLQKPG